MINLSLSGKEAIALHELLANRFLFQSQIPQHVKDALAKAQYEDASLSALQDHLKVELDVLLETRMKAAGVEVAKHGS